MTKSLAPNAMSRPNRRLGDVIRMCLGCPLCGLPQPGEQVRVISYRRYTVRVECTTCQLRFTVNRDDLVAAIDRIGGFTNALAGGIYMRHER